MTEPENMEDSSKVSPDSTSQILTQTVNSNGPRLLPLVFVQAPPNLKNNTSNTQNVNVTANFSQTQTINSNALIVNPNAGLKSNTNVSSVVLTSGGIPSKGASIILQKPNGGGQTLVPVSVATSTGNKQTYIGAYLGALVKNSNVKTSESILLPSPGLIKKTDTQIILPNIPTLVSTASSKTHLPAGLVPAPNNQKLVLTPMTMPKLATRLPQTVPTNSNSQPKIANVILPLPLNQSQSVINFKISNGQIQSDPKGSITVLGGTKKDTDVTSTTESVTEVIINRSVANNPPKLSKNAKKGVENDKQYELSISEEPKALNYTIKLSDDMKSYKIEQNGLEIDSIQTDIPHKLENRPEGQKNITETNQKKGSEHQKSSENPKGSEKNSEFIQKGSEYHQKGSEYHQKGSEFQKSSEYRKSSELLQKGSEIQRGTELHQKGSEIQRGSELHQKGSEDPKSLTETQKRLSDISGGHIRVSNFSGAQLTVSDSSGGQIRLTDFSGNHIRLSDIAKVQNFSDTKPTDLQSQSQPSVIVHPKRTLHEASILKKANNTYERKTYSKVPIIPKDSSVSVTITADKPIAPSDTKRSSERRRKSQYTYIRDFDEIVVTSGNAWDENDDQNQNQNDSGSNSNTENTKNEKLKRRDIENFGGEKNPKKIKIESHKKDRKLSRHESSEFNRKGLECSESIGKSTESNRRGSTYNRNSDFNRKGSDDFTEKYTESIRRGTDSTLRTSKSDFWDRNWKKDSSKIFESDEITFTKLSQELSTDLSENKLFEKDQIEIEVIKTPKFFETDDSEDIKGLLKWDEGIGFLDGSNLKFQVNEWGLIELLTGEDFKKFKQEFEVDTEILNCRECGCYGMPSEFISRSYCSVNCKTNAVQNLEKLKKETLNRDRIKPKKKGKDSEYSVSVSVNSVSDTENSSEPHPNYPWQVKKGFSWAKYLDHVKAKAAPLKLFKDPFPYSKNGFRVGMKLEGIDPIHPSNFSVMTIAEVQGYRIRLHFDGFSDSYDFWTNADSMDIFPMGWCEKFNHTLTPPPGFTEESFNWTLYLKNCKATAAPRHLFSNRAGNAICPNGFRLGMKLEAVDKKNSELICVATINDLMDQRFLVHFDSWDEQYDYWADPTSPYIHPVGWCDKYGHKLTPPNDYAEPDSFNWEDYLKETKATPVPARAFKSRPPNGFKKGMRIECVDKRVPQLVRVATIDEVKDHKIRVRFDGWPDKYSYWVDDDCTDIHPPGWCQKTGHPLEGPLMPEDVYENFDECPTIGCRGVGHILGALYDTHNTVKDCPYSDENLIDPPVIPDRLGGLRSSPIKVAVPVPREPKSKPSNSSSKVVISKIRKLSESEIKQEWPIEEDSDDSLKRKIPNSSREVSPNPSIESKYKISDEIHRKNSTNSENYNPSQKALVKHFKNVSEIIGENFRDPRSWNQDEVSNFVSSIPSCKDNSKIFIQELIDGEAFLMLTQKDLVEILKFKLGPAIKLYNTILLLRKNCSNIY